MNGIILHNNEVFSKCVHIVYQSCVHTQSFHAGMRTYSYLHDIRIAISINIFLVINITWTTTFVWEVWTNPRKKTHPRSYKHPLVKLLSSNAVKFYTEYYQVSVCVSTQKSDSFPPAHFGQIANYYTYR